MHAVADRYMMPCETERYAAYGDHVRGHPAEQAFTGTGYNENVRLMPDFVPRLLFARGGRRAADERGGGRAVTVLVDADACPVKRIIVEEARRRGVPVTMLTDTSHVLREDYAAVVTVEKGRDSVDFKLVTLCGAGDVVVTQDYGVAAMALAARDA